MELLRDLDTCAHTCGFFCMFDDCRLHMPTDTTFGLPLGSGQQRTSGWDLIPVSKPPCKALLMPTKTRQDKGSSAASKWQLKQAEPSATAGSWTFCCWKSVCWCWQMLAESEYLSGLNQSMQGACRPTHLLNGCYANLAIQARLTATHIISTIQAKCLETDLLTK